MDRKQEMMGLRFENKMRVVDIARLFGLSPQRVSKIIGPSRKLLATPKIKRAKLTLEDRFWKRISRGATDEDCWNWIGLTYPTGYGRLGLTRKSVYAHRLSWEIHFGPIPDGMFVCHKCDNPPCTNPAHLFLGTPKENIQDAIIKGRWAPQHKAKKTKGRA